MPDAQVTLLISEEDNLQFAEIAQNMGMALQAVLHDALAQYLADYRLEKADSEAALVEFESGKSIPHEEVVRRFTERLSKDQAA